MFNSDLALLNCCTMGPLLGWMLTSLPFESTLNCFRFWPVFYSEFIIRRGFWPLFLTSWPLIFSSFTSKSYIVMVCFISDYWVVILDYLAWFGVGMDRLDWLGFCDRDALSGLNSEKTSCTVPSLPNLRTIPSGITTSLLFCTETCWYLCSFTCYYGFGFDFCAI